MWQRESRERVASSSHIDNILELEATAQAYTDRLPLLPFSVSWETTNGTNSGMWSSQRLSPEAACLEYRQKRYVANRPYTPLPRALQAPPARKGAGDTTQPPMNRERKER